MLELLNRAIAFFNRHVGNPDTARRVIKTFVQAALAVVTLDTFDVLSITDWKTAVLAGVAAAWSVIQNTVIIPIWDKIVTAKREALIDPHADA